MPLSSPWVKIFCPLLFAFIVYSVGAVAAPPGTCAATAEVAILGPKTGLTLPKYEKIHTVAQNIITSLLPAAERQTIQHLQLTPDDDVSLELDAEPGSLVFEVTATALNSKRAAEVANNIAGQLIQLLPQADPVALQQIDIAIGRPAVILLLEPATSSLVTVVER